MKKISLVLIILLACCFNCLATWSVIMIDGKTNEIGIVGASCTYDCYGIGKIVPGVGAIIVQAMSNSQAREKGIEMIIAEAAPERIIQALRDPMFDPQFQQYAVVTIKYIDSPSAYTGDSAKSFRGVLNARGVSVQGNTLASDNELKTILAAVKKGQNDLLQIADILMNALEAGSQSGGDRRCGEQRSTSAFLIVARPDDKTPYLKLQIFGQRTGGQNAVELLRKKFDKWKRKHSSAK